MQQAERRATPRAETELQVNYRTAQEFTAAYVRNISGGGIFIRTQQPLPLNSEVQIRLTLPGHTRVLAVRGVVVWNTPYPSRSSFPSGMGIKFLSLEPDVQKLISGFVREKLSVHAREKKPPGA